jgi:hypothetical protein
MHTRQLRAVEREDCMKNISHRTNYGAIELPWSIDWRRRGVARVVRMGVGRKQIPAEGCCAYGGNDDAPREKKIKPSAGKKRVTHHGLLQKGAKMPGESRFAP